MALGTIHDGRLTQASTRLEAGAGSPSGYPRTCRVQYQCYPQAGISHPACSVLVSEILASAPGREGHGTQWGQPGVLQNPGVHSSQLAVAALTSDSAPGRAPTHFSLRLHLLP